jgi:hypothetical protein
LSASQIAHCYDRQRLGHKQCCTANEMALPCASRLTRTSASFHRVTAVASSASCSMNTRSCSLQTQWASTQTGNAEGPDSLLLSPSLRVPTATAARHTGWLATQHSMWSAPSRLTFTLLERHWQPLSGRRPAWAAPGNALGPLAHVLPALHPVMTEWLTPVNLSHHRNSSKVAASAETTRCGSGDVWHFASAGPAAPLHMPSSALRARCMSAETHHESS